MKIGIAKERKHGDKRVPILPSEVEKIVEHGHEVYVEKEAGVDVFVSDDEYKKAGAKIVTGPENIFNKDIVVKIKSPTDEEWTMLKDNILFCMLHPEQNADVVKKLEKHSVKGVAMEAILNEYEERLIDATDITGEQGMLYAFSQHSKSPKECEVLLLGYGRVGSAAAEIAHREGARVKILRKKEYKYIEHHLKGKDILANAITWPKYKREKREVVVREEMLKLLNPGAIVLDLAVDEPNPIETCRATTLSNPWYYVDLDDGRKVKHICIYGYPGLAPISCSERYSEQIAPLLLDIADNGLSKCSGYIKKGIVRLKK
ncbi:MAG: hypothetical protein ACE5J7_04875 [Candidatus Aenigmatarchaeota archaeon]